jgi:hypothetical protein
VSTHDAEPLLRPFLAAMTGQTQPAAEQTAGHTDESAVRPYFLTQGRVHEGGAIETVYYLTDTGAARRTSLTFEWRLIADLCQEPQSVAEISALLRIPLGVAAVLARDLVADNVLAASVAINDPTGDPHLIMRLIHAVHAL